MTHVRDIPHIGEVPRLGLIHALSDLIPHLRSEVLDKKREACQDCPERADFGPEAEHVERPLELATHSARWHGFDTVNAPLKSLFVAKGYAKADASPWKPMAMLTPLSKTGALNWERDALSIMNVEILYPPPDAQRQHLLMASKKSQQLSEVNYKIMLPTTKKMYDLEYLQDPIRPHDFARGNINDPLFGLFRAGPIGMAVYPIASFQATQAGITTDPRQLALAADPFVHPPLRPGGGDLPPIVGFFQAEPRWAAKFPDPNGDGKNVAHFISNNMVFIDKESPGKSDTENFMHSLFQHGIPGTIANGDGSLAAERVQSDADGSAPCQGPVCQPNGVAPTGRGIYCAKCVSQIYLAQGKQLEQFDLPADGTWEDLDTMADESAMTAAWDELDEQSPTNSESAPPSRYEQQSIDWGLPRGDIPEFLRWQMQRQIEMLKKIQEASARALGGQFLDQMGQEDEDGPGQMDTDDQAQSSAEPMARPKKRAREEG